MRLRFAHPWLLVGSITIVACLAEPQPGSPPLPPRPPSPVALFRELLELDEAERARTLASRGESQRRSIQAKLLEYESLSPAQRELQLRATELRWYLRPLFEIDPPQRTAHVAQVPESLRSLVERRLAAWDRLTPQVQNEFLQSDWALHYFLRPEVPTAVEPQTPTERVEFQRRQRLEREFARWQALPSQQRQRAAERFHRFFQLPPAEQEKTLDTLPESERSQIEATIEAFARLPAARRQATLEVFHRFADLTVAERAEFLRNADRWKEMSPDDRAKWRRLVPELPPSPPGLFDPPLPPSMPVRGAR